MSDERSLDDSVRKWVADAGYPLEMRAASAFRSAGLKVRQARHYIDPDSGKSREIDVECIADDKLGVARIRMMVECKTSKKPWVVFSSDEVLSGFNRLMSLGLLSDTARGALADQVLVLSERLGWFDKDGRIGYGAAVAFSDAGGEMPFAAMMAALKACLWEHDREESTFKPSLIATFPVVVIDAPLFERYLEGVELRVARVPQCELLYGGRIGRHFGPCVRIVAIEGLADFAEEAAREMANVQNALQPTIDREWQALKTRTSSGRDA